MKAAAFVMFCRRARDEGANKRDNVTVTAGMTFYVKAFGKYSNYRLLQQLSAVI